jgi:hypothetical protein
MLHLCIVNIWIFSPSPFKGMIHTHHQGEIVLSRGHFQYLGAVPGKGFEMFLCSDIPFWKIFFRRNFVSGKLRLFFFI